MTRSRRVVVFTPDAVADLAAAADWYESQRTGLRSAFQLAVEAAIDRIGREPHAFPVVHHEIRRVLLRRFPYALYYRLESDRSVVLAVYHCHRHPDGWKQRGV